MNKFLLAILAIALVLVSSLGLFACNDGGDGETPANNGLILTRYNGDDFYTVTGYDEESTETKLVIPAKADDGVAIKCIADGALDGCSFEEIEISSSIEEIGEGAFKNATKLKKITLPFIGKFFNADAYPNQTPEGESEAVDGDYSKVKAVDGQRSFGYIFSTESYSGAVQTSSSLGTYYLPATLRTVVINPKAEYEIPMQAFEGLLIVNQVIMKENVVGIGQSAFKNSKLIKANIPSTVKNIYDSAFEGAIVSLFTFEQDIALKELNDKVFFDAQIREIAIPNSVEIIGEECFGATLTTSNNVDTSASILEKVTLPERLTIIKRAAFKNCFELKTVDTTNVQNGGQIEIQDYAFINCKKLASLDKTIFKAIPNSAFLGTSIAL